MMDLLVVRHGRAEDRDEFAATGRPDSERPLTPKGIRRMIKAARGLHSLVPSIDLLVSSPLRRAVKTAQIIADIYGDLSSTEREELAPDAGPEGLIEWLAGQRKQGVTCVVGHEPDLSVLIEALLAEKSEVPAKLKKGSVTRLHFKGPIAASSGSMQWHHTARELAARA
jgi:phosphohistidine phosphatase